MPEAGAWSFDNEQQEIVHAPIDARLIVNAPPGTGKTAVACGRIAWLLEQGVPAHQIWLLSFTRTAIRELRNRIALLAESKTNVYAVRVATLDSRAWTLVQGFDGTKLADRVGGHDKTVEQALQILRSEDSSVFEFLDEISHVIVDEAQDLVGIRAEFVLELISRLPKRAGVTVLTDDAQSIYGFAEEEESEHETGTLPERLRSLKGSSFRERELSRVHRTSSPSLAELYVNGRRRVLKAVERGGAGALQVIRECVTKWNDGDAKSAKQQSPSENTLQLYRTRIEVLNASCWLGSHNTPHRIRMSAMPTVVHPWVGLALADFDGEYLSRTELADRWSRVSQSLGPLAPDLERCWADLLRATEDNKRVSMFELRRVLSRPRPPIEFVTNELGLTGPILGTIHASKGREADHVELMLPPERDDEAHPEEEARVLFVGATRARSSLRLGKGEKRGSARLSRGRRYSRLPHKGNTPRIRLEIGLDGDLDCYSPVARDLFQDESGADASQAVLQESITRIRHVCAWRTGSGKELRFVLRAGDKEDGQVLGALSSAVSWSVYEAKKTLSKDKELSVPQYIGPLFQFSVGTVVRDAEDPDLGNVHAPWRKSGIWLAPVITGLPAVPFFTKKYGR